MQELDQQTENVLNADSAAFKTWWVQLPMENASNVRVEIQEKLQWSRQMWYQRIHGKSSLKAAEKLIINQIAGKDLFV